MFYRNLTALELFFENNGYWFEGEQLFEGPLASGAAYRQIKMHQDVQLLCGEFIWDGMFDNLQISEDADSPFLGVPPWPLYLNSTIKRLNTAKKMTCVLVYTVWGGLAIGSM